jgi:hypothetical protein
MDGRTLIPLRTFGQKKFGATFPDTITEAGTVGIFAKNPSKEFMAEFKKKLNISLNLHHSKGILIYGHQDCAGHPVSDQQHKKDILKATNLVSSLVDEKIPVVPVFVRREGSDWVVEELEPNLG